MLFSNVIITSIALNTARRIIYFPLWWYSIGLKKRLSGLFHGIRTLFHNLGIIIMFKYLFKPMFGERSHSGRIISFFMRLLLLFWRLFLFLILTGVRVVLVLLWIMLLPFAVWQIFSLLL
ncbi:hypothetical protein MYX07_02185 [Patescibacteria group bacterium AH-259-L07]|nr:hypothetical protein [Patescibacteria group bacterium AH-259-L07]